MVSMFLKKEQVSRLTNKISVILLQKQDSRWFYGLSCDIYFFKLFIFGCAGSSLLHRLFSSYGRWGLLSSPGYWASLVAEQRFKAPRLQQLWLRLSYS